MAYCFCVTISLSAVTLCLMARWDIVGLIRGAMLLKKLMDKYKCPEYLVPTPPKNPEEVHQLLGKYKPHTSFLSIAQYHGYQHAKALALHSRGPAASSKDPVHIALVVTDPILGR